MEGASMRIRKPKLAVISYRCLPERERVLTDLAEHADMTVSQLEHRLSDIGLETVRDLRSLRVVRAMEILMRQCINGAVHEMVMAGKGSHLRRKSA
jgi:hypothetical protein